MDSIYKNEGTVVLEKSFNDDEKGILTILIATIGEFDKQNDRYLPESVLSRDTVPMAQYGHSEGLPIGTGNVIVKGNGVYWEGQLDLENTDALTTYNHIKKMGGSQDYSFRATINGSDYVRNNRGGRDIRKMTIYEVSPVLNGAGNQTGTVIIKDDENNYNKDKEVNNIMESNILEQPNVIVNVDNQELVDVVKNFIEASDAKENEQVEGLKQEVEELRKAFATPKSDNYDNRKNSHDLMKALFDQSGLRDEYIQNKGREVVREVKVDNMEIIKAALNGYGRLDYNTPPVGAIMKPVETLDQILFLPVSGNSVRERVVSVSNTNIGDAVNNTNKSHEAPATVTPQDFPIEDTIAYIDVTNSTLEDGGPEFMSTLEVQFSEEMRLALETKIWGDAGTAGLLKGFNATSANGGLGTGSAATAVPVLSGATGLDKVITDLRNAGGRPTAIVCNGDTALKVHSSLRKLGFATPEYNRYPYGGTLGVPVIMSANLPSNTAFVVSFGSKRYHWVAVKMEMTVSMSTEEKFSSDVTVVKAKMRVANIINQPNAHKKITATNLWTVES